MIFSYFQKSDIVGLNGFSSDEKNGISRDVVVIRHHGRNTTRDNSWDEHL
ncbi:hypothetical protein BH23THE1_BH23THE1_00280 [soil metagenome]